MSCHIFLASKDNFEKCIEMGVYGGSFVTFERSNSEVNAGFCTIKKGNFIFFYVKNVGLYGLWKVTSDPFYDETNIYGVKDQIYPYRTCFEPTIRKFSKPIALSDILDLRDKGKIWTFDLGAITKKNHHPVTTEEGKELIRLLLRNNSVYHPVPAVSNPYRSNNVPLPIKLNTDKKGQIEFEGYLNAWLMRTLLKGKLKELIGEYYDVLNYVPTSFNKVMDVFLTHVTKVDSVDILHKYTCMELKTKIADEEDLNQIIKYENWLVRKLANGDSEMVQSILIAFDFDDKVIDYVKKRKLIEEKTVRLITYRVNDTKDDVILKEVKFGG